jgi:hypothetical protein
MNSASPRNRRPWTDQRGGASRPDRQRAREAGAHARPEAGGQRLAWLTALVIGVWLIWAPPSDASPWKYKVVQMVQCEQLEGLSDWLPQYQKKVREASWTFYADGRFVYAAPGWTVLHGRYQGAMPLFSFRAEARESTSSSRLNSSGSYRVEGTLDFRSARPLLAMEESTEGELSVMTGGRLINQQKRSRYRTQVAVVQTSQ